MLQDKILENNLEMMLGRKTGQMMRLLMNESFGGNAGDLDDGRPCAAANFHYDAVTGEIKYFGNFQNVPEEIREKYYEGIFRVAVSFQNQSMEIVQFLKGSITPEAEGIIQKSIDEFNKRH